MRDVARDWPLRNALLVALLVVAVVIGIIRVIPRVAALYPSLTHLFPRDPITISRARPRLPRVHVLVPGLPGEQVAHLRAVPGREVVIVLVPRRAGGRDLRIRRRSRYLEGYKKAFL